MFILYLLESWLFFMKVFFQFWKSHWDIQQIHQLKVGTLLHQRNGTPILGPTYIFSYLYEVNPKQQETFVDCFATFDFVLILGTGFIIWLFHDPCKQINSL